MSGPSEPHVLTPGVVDGGYSHAGFGAGDRDGFQVMLLVCVFRELGLKSRARNRSKELWLVQHNLLPDSTRG